MYFRAMRFKHYIFVLLFTGMATLSSTAQEIRVDSNGKFEGEIEHIDHEDLELIHSPKKATILSACLPGAGQIYNKKWWKAPIVWIGIGTSIYLSQDYRGEYNKWKEQYIRRLDPDQTDDYPLASNQSIESQMLTYRKWMETSYVVAGAIYILQILDANVDAQLMSFDVSDDLSLNVMPNVFFNQRQPKPTYGLTLSLGFK